MGNHASTDKSVGTILGMAVANALGAPGEGKSKEQLAQEFGCLDHFQESFDLEEFAGSSGEMDPQERETKIARWMPAGVYRDDTQQALALCECLLNDEDLLGESFAEKLCSLSYPRGRGFRFGIFRGAGRSFRDSIRSLEDGENWRLSGQESASNGAAMRVAPLGIFFREDLDKLKQRVIDQSVLTHRDAMAIAAAQAIAHTIALVIRLRQAPPPEELLGQILEQVRAAEDLAAEQEDDAVSGLEESRHGFSEALARMSEYLSLPLDEGLAKIGEYAESTSDRAGIGATGGYVLSSVITALYIFLKHPGSYERAVVAAINQGGDTDTIGAMVGAMAGALHGISAVPARWIQGLRNVDQIRLRAIALISIESAVGKRKTLYDAEMAICNEIYAARRDFLPAEYDQLEERPRVREPRDREDGGETGERREDGDREPRRESSGYGGGRGREGGGRSGGGRGGRQGGGGGRRRR